MPHYTNPGPLRFTAPIQSKQMRNNVATYLEFPYDLKQTFGVGNLVPFIATFDGRVKYQGSLAKMGGDCAMILLRKDILAEIGKDDGEMVDVKLELDDAPRVVQLPDYLQAALDRAGLLEAWFRQPPSHQREHVNWVIDAKKPETRAKRITKVCEMVRVKYA